MHTLLPSFPPPFRKSKPNHTTKKTQKQGILASLYLSAAIASGSPIPRILSSESHHAGDKHAWDRSIELEVTLRWDCLFFFFIFLLFGDGRPNTQWCACGDGMGRGREGEGGVETRLIWGDTKSRMDWIGWMGKGGMKMIGRVGEWVVTVCIA